MTYIEIAIVAILGLSCVIGLISGLVKGWIKGLARCITVIAAIVCAFAFRQTLTDLVCFKIQINGSNIYQLVEQALEKAGSQSASGTGVNLSNVLAMAWPLVEILISVAVFFVSLAIFVLLSNIIYGILCIFLKPFKGKAKLRPVGGLVGLLTGGVVGLCLCSVVSGVATNASSILEVTFQGQSIKSYLKIDENSDTWKKIGLGEYKDSWVAKPMSVVDKAVFNNVTSITFEGKTYTLAGQLDAYAQSAKLADSFTSIATVNFEDAKSVENLAASFKTLDFKNMDEEEKEVVNSILDIIIPKDAGVTVTVEDLASINFECVGDSLVTVSEMINGDDVSQSDVNKMVENLAKSGALEITNTFNVSIKDDLDKETAASLKTAVQSLTVSESSGITQHDINSLNELFGF